MKANDLVNETMAKAQALEPDEVSKFFIEMGILSFGVLRTVQGDQFVIDYLTAAIKDKNPIKISVNTSH